MKLEVPHSNESLWFISEIVKNYKQVYVLPKTIKSTCVVHMYPYKDTILECGATEGYINAYNCILHIYDVDNKTVFKTIWHDEIDISVPCRIRIFKDLSTMIIINVPVEFVFGRSFSIRRTD